MNMNMNKNRKWLQADLFKDALFRRQVILLGCALTCLLLGSMFQYRYTPALWMTYRDFDVPDQKNFINYLSPGIKDVSSHTQYDFKHKNRVLLFIVLFVFFPLMLFLRSVMDRDVKLGIIRFLTQWLTFVIARLGIFRVAGICPVKRTGLGVFPFMNCQSCELATGACPLGTFQMSLVNREIPLALIGQIILTGLISGRWICGWLCPFGFLSDIFDKIPGKRIKLPQAVTWVKYGMLGLFLFTSLLYFFKKDVQTLFYCSFICPAGFYYGVLEYALTTGVHAISKEFPYLHFMLIYHFMIAIAFIIGSVKLGGRFFCKYFCPLGTIYGLFNQTALVRLVLNSNKCKGCQACEKVCPMHISILNQKHISRSSCIVCGRCRKVCPAGKIEFKAGILNGSRGNITKQPN